MSVMELDMSLTFCQKLGNRDGAGGVDKGDRRTKDYLQYK